MDSWQKIEIASKAVAALFIPIALAFLGNQVATSNKQRDSEIKFVELATAILRQDPKTEQTSENRNLRLWAVEVINRYSGVPMSNATATALVENTTLPQSSTFEQATSASDPSGTWGVVFGGDTTLEAAKFEVTKTAQRMGIGDAAVFRRSGSFRSVKVVVSRAEAEDIVGKAQVVRPSSYVVNMSTWCPTSEAKDGYFECSKP